MKFGTFLVVMSLLFSALPAKAQQTGRWYFLAQSVNGTFHTVGPFTSKGDCDSVREDALAQTRPSTNLLGRRTTTDRGTAKTTYASKCWQG